MHLYVGKTFTATASGSAMREVICEKCRCHFFYQLARAAKGTAEAPYYIGQDAAALRAQHRAQAKVDKMLKEIKNEQDHIVYIKSGIKVSYGDVVAVINEVRKLGVDKIGLVADKKKGGEGATKPS